LSVEMYNLPGYPERYKAWRLRCWRKLARKYKKQGICIL